ncbi:hypothetical protein EVAR_76465_1 [Eumeta japonica]|uniref:Uncharacterized protein n=1 Tax=Eumeta variegata TaxID=151549 RepID=A0A4C1T5L8_EUMVA|nr:hypothetical protein EVAR_76465_1 [Eumeta japonica]
MCKAVLGYAGVPRHTKVRASLGRTCGATRANERPAAAARRIDLSIVIFAVAEPENKIMKNQQVGVDFSAMAKAMLTYGAVTVLCWLMLRLFGAVFSLPQRIRAQQNQIQNSLQELQPLLHPRGYRINSVILYVNRSPSYALSISNPIFLILIDSNPVPALVLNPIPVFNVVPGPPFDFGPGTVLDSPLRPAFKFNSAAGISSDLIEDRGKLLASRSYTLGSFCQEFLPCGCRTVATKEVFYVITPTPYPVPDVDYDRRFPDLNITEEELKNAEKELDEMTQDFKNKENSAEPIEKKETIDESKKTI